MLVPNRHGSSTAYRYGFQGQEKDDELKGEGNSLNYTFRMHDPRVGRFFTVDPLEKDYPWYTPYQFSGNKVIAFVELEGLEENEATYNRQTEHMLKTRNIKYRAGDLKKAGKLMVLTEAAILDAVFLRGFGFKLIMGGSLLEALNEGDRANEAMSKGDLEEAQRRYNNTAEKTKIVILGILAEGAGYAVGKIIPQKNWTGKFEDSNVVNESFVEAGYFPPYKANVTLGLIKAPKEIKNLVRLSGPNNVEGAWVTTAKEIEGLTAVQLKDKFSLKHLPTQVTPVTIGANSTIRVGEASAVKQFKTNGGGYQIEVLEGKINYGKSVPIE
jgi:RHS repeat-associated protein